MYWKLWDEKGSNAVSKHINEETRSVKHTIDKRFTTTNGQKVPQSAQCVIEFANIVTLLTRKEVKLTTNSNIRWRLIVRKCFWIMHKLLCTIAATRVAQKCGAPIIILVEKQEKKTGAFGKKILFYSRVLFIARLDSLEHNHELNRHSKL